jgi:hypothetical protein
MSQSYGYAGFSQFLASLLCYFIVLNDFGFHPNQLLFKAAAKLILHDSGNVYNPTAWNFGNSLLSSTNCNQNT